MERFRQRYGIALTKKKLQEIILMLMAWEAVFAFSSKKGIMLKQAMKHFGFLPEEVVVFGDGENDISMFQEFPCSYAMINGVDALKQFAYRVTEYSNDEDGVAKTVEKILKA